MAADVRAADYAALAARLDEVLHLGIEGAMPLLPTEVKPATVAARLAECWWGTPALLPPLVGKSKKAKSGEPCQVEAMSTRFEFVIRGEVVPTARPRVFRHGGIGLPLPYVLFRRAVQRAAILAGAKQIPSDAWRVGCVVAMWQLNPLARPDVDNAAKGVLDALTGAGLFRDERVTNLSVSKLTGPAALSVRVLW